MPVLKQTKKKSKSKTETQKTGSFKSSAKKETAKTVSGLSIQIYDTAGKKVGTQKLPIGSFSSKSNDHLLSQAVRVYQTNMSTHNANTKTRGEVRGGGAKPWKQKGTGNARAGSRRSPLWVGGAITFGPRSRKVKLSLPQKMKHKALITALSGKNRSGGIYVISDLERIKPKTKIIANLLKALDVKGKSLIVISQKNPNVILASRNVKNLEVDLVQNLNTYQVLKAAGILFSKEALGALK